MQSYANWALAHLSEADDDRPSTVGSPAKTFSQLGTPGKFSLHRNAGQVQPPPRRGGRRRASSRSYRRRAARSSRCRRPSIPTSRPTPSGSRTRSRARRRTSDSWRGGGTRRTSPSVLVVSLGPGVVRSAVFFRFGVTVALLKKNQTSDFLDGAWESHVCIGGSRRVAFAQLHSINPAAQRERLDSESRARACDSTHRCGSEGAARARA